jgi:stress response protein YsnF
VDQPLTGANLNADDLLRERTVELTETSEEAVVAKNARVVEEVVVRKDVEQRTETIEDTVRHTEVDVDRTPGSANLDRR